MEQLVEHRTDNLWPFGNDKRMLSAIYAHFNTMIKKRDDVDLSNPVVQKIQNVLLNLKSIIQIITGMRIESIKLDRGLI